MFKKYFVKLSVLFIVLLGSFFLFHGFYFAVNIKGPAIEKKFYTFNNKPFNDSIKLKLHVYNTGINKVASLLVGDKNPWRPVPTFVIEHPKYGLIVFDSGLSSKVALMGKKTLHPITRLLFNTHSLKSKDLPSQMVQDSLLPIKVERVIFSHLHFDHIGNSDAFSKATYYVGQGTDLDNMTRMEGFEPDFMAKLIHNHAFKEIDFSVAKPFATFEKAVDLLGDGGLIAIQGNGHLTGSISLFVNLPQGLIFLAGDEAVHFDWLNNDDVQKISKNPKRAAEMRNRIRMLRELRPDIIIFPGHDFPKIPLNRTDIVVNNPILFTKEAWPLN